MFVYVTAIAIDTVSFPEDKYGNKIVFVVVNLQTRFTHLFAAKDKTALSAANALFSYYVYYSGFSVVHSDPGSEFTSGLFTSLTRMLGAEKTFSMIDNPWADGVEPTVKQLKRHLIAVCMESAMLTEWSSPPCLALVQLILNSRHHSQTDATPYELTFGNLQQIKRDSPLLGNFIETEGEERLEFLKLLNDNLKFLRKRSAEFEEKLLAERNTPPDAVRNSYVKGDLVFHRIREKLDVPSLHPRMRGPYEVREHRANSNRVSVCDMIKQNILELNVGELVIFSGSKEEAFKLAMYDTDQYFVENILGYRGTPLKRTNMEFKVQYRSGEILWLVYNDLRSSSALESFISRNRHLNPLNFNAADASRLRTQRNNLGIDSDLINSEFFLNLRALGPATYVTLEKELGSKWLEQDFYVPAKLVSFVEGKKEKLFYVQVTPLKLKFEADGYFWYLYGGIHEVPPGGILLKDAFIKKNFKRQLQVEKE